ncbi:hypothetical protein AHF37_00462 [Paragonimus kellicotti]|nr:hypothetical protein AHF37_00462 [Paragonimus kellicotti]
MDELTEAVDRYKVRLICFVTKVQKATKEEFEEAKRLSEELTHIHNTKQDEMDEKLRASMKENLDASLSSFVKNSQDIDQKNEFSSVLVSKSVTETKSSTSTQAESKASDEERLNRRLFAQSIRDQLRANIRRSVHEGELECMYESAERHVQTTHQLSLAYTASEMYKQPADSYNNSVPNGLHEGRTEQSYPYDVGMEHITWVELRRGPKLDDHSIEQFFSKEWTTEEPDQSLDAVVDSILQHSTGLTKSQCQKKKIKNKGQESSSTYLQLVDETEPLISDLGMIQKRSKDCILFGRATWPANWEREDAEAGFLYYPPDEEAPTELKTGGQVPRYLDEEGLYIGRSLYMVPSNIRRLENRIIQQATVDTAEKNVLTVQPKSSDVPHADAEMQNRKKQLIQPWFGEDGKLALQPNPTRSIPNRFSFWDDHFNPIPDALKTDYIPPLSCEALRHYLASTHECNDLACPNNATLGGRRRRASVSTYLNWEHLYAQNLQEVVRAYENEVARDQVNACIQRIRALKRALQQITEKRQSIPENSMGNSVAAQLDKSIKEYEREISLMRCARNHAESVHRGLLASALRAWKRVKSARQVSGCVNTTARLTIIRQAIDEVEAKREWNQELDELVAEAQKQHNDCNTRLKEQYLVQLNKYKQAKRKHMDALKRQRQRESGQKQESEDGETSLNELEKEDTRILAKGHAARPPTPPPQFNATWVREQAEQQMKKCRRFPGEPRISVILSKSMEVTPEATCTKDEAIRRKNVSNCLYYFKLYYNRKFVGATKPLPLSQDFVLRLGWTYPLQICHFPETIIAKLYEKRGLCAQHIADFNIPPPEIGEDKATQRTHQPSIFRPGLPEVKKSAHYLKFCIPNEKSVKHFQADNSEKQVSTTVGAPCLAMLEALDGSGEKLTVLTVNGTLVASATWTTPGIGLETSGASRDSNIRRVRSTEDVRKANVFANLATLYGTGAGGDPLVSISTDVSTVEDNIKLDPNNPAGAQMTDLTAAESYGTPSAVGDTFANTPQLTLSNQHVMQSTRAAGLCSDADLDNCRRLRLLQLRNAGVSQFENLIIPASAKFIPSDIFKDYEQITKKESRITVTGMEAYHVRRRSYLKKMKNQVEQRFQEALKKKSFKEMVVEEQIPNMMFVVSIFKQLFQARRPLRAVHQQRRRMAPQSLRESGLEVRAIIYAAHNLPARQPNVVAQADSRSLSRLQTEPIRPFAEIRFQNHISITPTSEGSNPSWNSELRLPFTFQSTSMQLEAINDPLIINVYDEITVNFRETSGSRKNVLRIERRFLGGLEIPFSTIYQNYRVEGQIPLKIPLILLGYEAPDPLKSSTRPMIHLFITLEPNVSPADPMITKFATVEPKEVLMQISDWQERVKKQKFFQERQFNPMVLNSDCKEVMVTRYLNPLNPPEDILPASNPDVTRLESMTRLARYVSLIPNMSDAAFFRGLADIWCTSDQFLNMLCGDDEEHAVLLACYFLYLEKIKFISNDNELSELDSTNAEGEDCSSVFLCLGEAVPEGRTTYVLTRKQKKPDSKHALAHSWHLWNPSTGDSYSVTNVSCPMRAVYGLVSAQNVWANVQTKHEPWEIDWNLSDRNAWAPLFQKTFQSKKHPSHSVNVKQHSPVLSTVQPLQLIYEELDSREVDLVKFEIEATLRDALMNWRKSQITRLNYEYVSDLTKVLENLERHAGQRYDGLTQVLDRITSKYHVYGFPMNFPYMKTEAIIERVRSKGIHELHGTDDHADINTAEDRFSEIVGSRYATSVQYAMAVYVKAYKGPVLSIWIYLAALWRR